MTAKTLAKDITAVDPRLSIEWIGDLCVLHGPADLPVAVEVQGLRVVERVTDKFVWRPDGGPRS